MAEIIIEKIAEEAAHEIMNQVRSDTGMTLKVCYEKQIPQKMKFQITGEWCPRCTRRLIGYDGLRDCYCKFCGQRIDRK